MKKSQKQISKNRKISVFGKKVIEIWISMSMAQESPGESWRLQESPGASRRIQTPPRDAQSLLESPGVSWRLLEVSRVF